MATYFEIMEWVENHYGFEVKACYIADVKEKCGLHPKPAWNRADGRKHLCPSNKVEPIKDAFRHFKMI